MRRPLCQSLCSLVKIALKFDSMCGFKILVISAVFGKVHAVFSPTFAQQGKNSSTRHIYQRRENH